MLIRHTLFDAFKLPPWQRLALTADDGAGADGTDAAAAAGGGGGGGAAVVGADPKVLQTGDIVDTGAGGLAEVKIGAELSMADLQKRIDAGVEASLTAKAEADARAAADAEAEAKAAEIAANDPDKAALQAKLDELAASGSARDKALADAVAAERTRVLEGLGVKPDYREFVPAFNPHTTEGKAKAEKWAADHPDVVTKTVSPGPPEISIPGITDDEGGQGRLMAADAGTITAELAKLDARFGGRGWLQ